MLRKPSGVIALFSLLLLTTCGGGGGGGGDAPPDTNASPPAVATAHSINVQGVSRTYSLYVPPSFIANVGGLIVALHGAGGSATEFEALTQLSVKAQRAGFAVAYLDGTNRDWNYLFSGPLSTDDVGFVRAVIGNTQSSIHPDPKHVYVTGFSNGGRMANRAAIELSDLIAAVGVVEGTLYSNKTSSDHLPNPLVPVSEIAIQGDQDVLFCGGGITQANQDDVFSYWSGPTVDNCRSIDTTLGFCTGPTPLYEKAATNCASNAEVKTYILIGGIHTWYTVPMNDPARMPYNPALTPVTGVTTNDILWNFFVAHPKQ